MPRWGVRCPQGVIKEKTLPADAERVIEGLKFALLKGWASQRDKRMSFHPMMAW